MDSEETIIIQAVGSASLSTPIAKIIQNAVCTRSIIIDNTQRSLNLNQANIVIVNDIIKMEASSAE
jgi:hypothetical protein